MRQAARHVTSAAASTYQSSLASRTAGNAADLASIKWKANLEPPVSAAMAACSPTHSQRSFSSAAIARRGTQKVLGAKSVICAAFVWCCSQEHTAQTPAASFQEGSQGSATKAALLFVLPCAFTAFLGTWQLQRREWKANLIHNRDQALQVNMLYILCM